jgi:DNA polymerase III alpha subunit
VLVVNEIAPRETDCRLEDLASRDDDEIVAVRGVIVEAKTVRTRAGSPLMFAKIRAGDTCVDVLIFAGAMERAGLL